VKLSLDVKLTPAQVAEAFADLDDEQQTRFFVEVARIASTWEPGTAPQWRLVSRHLRDCPCSTDDARELVRDLAHALGGES